MDHPKNLIEVLRARLAIEKGLIGNAITIGPNKYRFTRTFLDGEALRIFNLKATELVQETVPNLKNNNEPRCKLFWPKGVSLQAEALLVLKDDQAPQADHEAVCGLGPRPQFKDGSVATSLRGLSNA